MSEKCYYVYIMASRSRVLYTGITSVIRSRVWQHKTGALGGFTAKYKIHRLVYFERFKYVRNAIAREKEIKDWRRELRVALIEENNPTWEDLSAGWYDINKTGE
jgi:putative endonuclease